MKTIKIMTYNIQSGHNADYAVALDATAAYIKSVGAPIVGLNELDVRNGRSKGLDQLEFIRERAGYPYAAFGRSIDFMGGYYGNGLISKYPIISRELFEVPQTDPSLNSRVEPRSILRVTLDVEGSPLTVMVTHYGLSVEERTKAVALTVELVKDAEHPVIFMGDLNATPNSTELKPLCEVLVDTAKGFDEADLLSIDSKSPNRRIDFIFATPNVKVNAVKVPKVLYSDHCPYIADVEF